MPARKWIINSFTRARYIHMTLPISDPLTLPMVAHPTTKELHSVETYRDATTGDIVSEKWRNKDNQFDRKDGPAVISRDPSTGILFQEDWYRNGTYHRDGGPACIRRDPVNGGVMLASWYDHGKRHRADGPAVIQRDSSTGAIINEEYWKAGVYIIEDKGRPVRGIPPLPQTPDGEPSR